MCWNFQLDVKKGVQFDHASRLSVKQRKHLTVVKNTIFIRISWKSRSTLTNRTMMANHANGICATNARTRINAYGVTTCLMGWTVRIKKTWSWTTTQCWIACVVWDALTRAIDHSWIRSTVTLWIVGTLLILKLILLMRGLRGGSARWCCWFSY